MFPRTLVALTGLLAATTVAGAQTITVTPTMPQGWHNTDHAGTPTVGITTAFPRSGNGSLEFQGTSGADKDYEGVNFAPQLMSNVTSASFDWYRSSTSTVGAGLAPSYHFLIDAIDANGGNNFSELVWENTYQTNANAPTDQWISSNIIGDQFWRAMGGPTNTSCGHLNTDGGAQKFGTISDWLSSCYSGQTVYTYGVSVGFGSGWNGTFDGAVDNVHIGFGDAAGVTYNFEPDITTTPEPSSMALIGTGLFGLVPMIRRRRK